MSIACRSLIYRFRPISTRSSTSLHQLRNVTTDSAGLYDISEWLRNKCTLRKIPKPTPSVMSKLSRRTGSIGIKCGMTSAWNKMGYKFPLTVLWLDDTTVSQVKTLEKDGVSALQVGCGHKSARQCKKPELGHFRAQGVHLMRHLKEFSVTEDALLPVGTRIDVRHFLPGQYVDICGLSIDKGFQGVVKRWGFAGGPASKRSKAARQLGSVGALGQGRVFPGKKMPGHMGNKKTTVKGVLVYKIDARRDLMWVRGQVPGPSSRFLTIRDTTLYHKKPDPTTLPFPTFLPPPGEDPATLKPVVCDWGLME